MKDVLERLTTARGVRSAAVFDNDGMCVASHGDATLATLGMSLQVMLSPTTAWAAAQANWLIARFEGGTLAVRRTPNAMLVVVADPDVDMSVAGAGFAINIALQVINLRVGSRRPPASQTVPVISESESIPLPAAVPKI